MGILNYGDTTKEEFNKRIKEILNSNNPSTLGTTPFQSYRWVKAVLNELKITFDDSINSAWSMFLNLDNANLKFLIEPTFLYGVYSGFNNNFLSKEILDGSIVFGYFVGNPYVFRSIDEMYFQGLGSLGSKDSKEKLLKEKRLKKFLILDAKSNPQVEKEDLGWYDPTPLNKMIFSEVGYKSKWDEVRNKDFIGKKIPIAPINHIGIFYDKQLFSLSSSLTVEPAESLRIVAHYPFKKILFNKLNVAWLEEQILKVGQLSSSMSNLKGVESIVKTSKEMFL
jgi:hypothetical protein